MANKNLPTVVLSPSTQPARAEDDPAFAWRETPLAQDVAGAPRELEIDYQAGPGVARAVRDPDAKPVAEELRVTTVADYDSGEWEIATRDGKKIATLCVGFGRTLRQTLMDVVPMDFQQLTSVGPGKYEARLTDSGLVTLQLTKRV